MADQRTLPLPGLDRAFYRARQVRDEHSLWQPDPHSPHAGNGHGQEQHFSWGNALELANTITPYLSPGQLGFAIFRDREHHRRIVLALGRSSGMALQACGEELGATALGVIEGILPTLKQMAEAAGIGALTGGVVGAFGGLGVLDEMTIPGGAMLGAEIGLWVAGMLGLKDLLVHAVTNLDGFARHAAEATELAWYAGEDHLQSEDEDIQAAATLYALAISELWLAILDAIIFVVMKRAGELAGRLGKRIAPAEVQEALAQMRGKYGKLGPKFGEWLEKNFGPIQDWVKGRKKVIDEIEKGEQPEGGGAPEKPIPPWKGPTDYSKLKNPRGAGPFKKVTTAQKEKIYATNRAHNDGLLRDDVTGEVLVEPSKSVSGETPPSNEAQVDHIKPRSKGGTNEYDNLQVRSRKANRAKSDTWNEDQDQKQEGDHDEDSPGTGDDTPADN